MRLSLLTAVLGVLAATAGCSHLQTNKGDGTVCPEHRSITCLSAPQCALDRTRGCLVCQCSSPMEAPTRVDLGQPSARPFSPGP